MCCTFGTQGDTLLLSVGLSAAALSVGQQPSQGPTAHLDPEAAQQLLAGSERAAAADAELAAAAAALEVGGSVFGCPRRLIGRCCCGAYSQIETLLFVTSPIPYSLLLLVFPVACHSLSLQCVPRLLCLIRCSYIR